MDLSSVLLVTRNYQGICEENFLSTVDEFVKKFCTDDAFFADSLKNVLTGAKPFEWAGTYYARADDSYDMRLCCGADDLLKFLAGDYNDSIEKMENRNPGSCGTYEGWYWENNKNEFSPRAITAVKEHARASDKAFLERLFSIMPDFPTSAAVVRHDRKPSLLESIEYAKNYRTTKKEPSSFVRDFER